jgi:hypothetical protein
MGPSFVLSGMGMFSFWIGHLSLVSYKVFEFIQSRIDLARGTRTVSFLDDVPAHGTDPLTVLGTQRP